MKVYYSIFESILIYIMARYFIDLSFKGTCYHGWQSQPNALSVQAEIEKALKVLTSHDIKVTGAGRTDTGVHANFYTAHFDTDHPLPGDGKNFMYKMNAILPPDIAVNNAYEVRSDAHARYSAISRTYKYTISKVKNPFLSEFAWYYSLPLNIEVMNTAAQKLMEYSDFTSFSKLHTDVKNNICKITECRWVEESTNLIFIITANRFLRNMVRSIVGTMIDVGRGKISLEDFVWIIESKNRNLAGFSVPPQGLTLYSILYIDVTSKLC